VRPASGPCPLIGAGRSSRLKRQRPAERRLGADHGGEEAIRAACCRWRVRELVADPYRWARSLQILAGEGLPIMEFPQTAPRMAPATSRFTEAVLNGALTHNGDRQLAQHVANAVIKEDQRGGRLSKPDKNSPRRIDAPVAAVMAFHRAAYLCRDGRAATVRLQHLKSSRAAGKVHRWRT
jgi:phage terminase large subunit-like protein